MLKEYSFDVVPTKNCTSKTVPTKKLHYTSSKAAPSSLLHLLKTAPTKKRSYLNSALNNF